MDRNERIQEVLITQLDTANARADQAEALCQHRTIVLLALFARCQNKGSVVVSKEELEAAQGANVDLQDLDGDLALIDQLAVQAEVQRVAAGNGKLETFDVEDEVDG